MEMSPDQHALEAERLLKKLADEDFSFTPDYGMRLATRANAHALLSLRPTNYGMLSTGNTWPVSVDDDDDDDDEEDMRP